MEFFTKVFTQFSNFVASLSVGRRIGLVATLGAVVGGFVLISFWATRVTYQPLMTNLNSEDSANIIRVLRQRKVPFRVSSDGKSISVPPESVFDLRLELATSGLPESSVVGYEVFDQQTIGTTSFVQQVNRKRALEGELMRTIGALKGVRKARVHLAIPKKSPFIEKQKPTTASVVLDLDPGVRMSDKQIFGVQNLVASAIAELEISKVVVVNSHGKTLSKNRRDPEIGISADQLDLQRKVETDLELRIKEILEPIVGEGRIVAKVSTLLDFASVNEMQTIYDPDGAALKSSEKRTNNMQAQRPGPNQAPGAVNNQPGVQRAPAGNADIRTDTNNSREVANFAVPKTVKSTKKPTGTIKKLSVAVVLDRKKVDETLEDGTVQSKTEPWTEEQLVEFGKIVGKAVGLDAKRGDTIEIKNLQFAKEDFAEAERLLEARERRIYFQNLITYSVIGIIVILFFWLVVKPFIKWVTENTVDSVDTFLPQTIEELEKIQKNQTLPGLEDSIPELPEQIDPEKIEGEMIKEKIITMVDNSPHKAALILRDWIRSEKSDPAKDKKEA